MYVLHRVERALSPVVVHLDHQPMGLCPFSDPQPFYVAPTVDAMLSIAKVWSYDSDIP